MIVQSLSSQKPFVTKDGSMIRSILDRTNAPVEHQSLAEASLPLGAQTERHFHKVTEEFYFILEGSGHMEVDGVERDVSHGDCILIPPGAFHQIRSTGELRFLCCCSPPYSHDDTFME